MTRKNGSQKRDKRNLKKLQENLCDVFYATSFVEAPLKEDTEDTCAKEQKNTAKEQKKDENADKEQKKGENTVKVLLAGTEQHDIRFRAEKELVIDWYEDVVIEENEKNEF